MIPPYAHTCVSFVVLRIPMKMVTTRTALIVAMSMAMMIFANGSASIGNIAAPTVITSKTRSQTKVFT
jgi:hypothetical protein